MMTWLLGTRLGRWVSAALAAFAVVFTAFIAGKREGKQAQKTEGLKQSLETSNKAREKQDDIRKASPDDVVRRLDGWMRDDD